MSPQVRRDNGRRTGMQKALDEAFIELKNNHSDAAYIWDLNKTKYWGKQPASDKQLAIITRRCKGFKADGISKFEASQILNRILSAKKAG